MANDLLLRENFERFSLKRLLADILAPYNLNHRLRIAGPDVSLPPRLGTPLALVLHELATNAARFGSLSVPEGTLSVSWELGEQDIRLVWQEGGGPPVTKPPRLGFGTRLISEILRPELGYIELMFDAGGLRYEVAIPSPPSTPG